MASTRSTKGTTRKSPAGTGGAIEQALQGALLNQLNGSALEAVLSQTIPSFGKKPADEGMAGSVNRFEKAVGSFESIIRSSAPAPKKPDSIAKNGEYSSVGLTEKETKDKTKAVGELDKSLQTVSRSTIELKANVEELSGVDGRGGIGQVLSQMRMWKEATDELEKSSKLLSKTHQMLGKAAIASAKDSAKTAIETSAKTVSANIAAAASSGAKGIAGAAGNAMMFPPPANAILLAAGIAAVVGAIAVASKLSTSGGAKAIQAPSASPPAPSSLVSFTDSEKDTSDTNAKNDKENQELGDSLPEQIAKGVSDGISRRGTNQTDKNEQPTSALSPSFAQPEPIGAGDNRNDPGRTEEITNLLEQIRSNTEGYKEPEIRAYATDDEGRRIRTKREAEEARKSESQTPVTTSDQKATERLVSQEEEQTKLLRAISQSLRAPQQPQSSATHKESPQKQNPTNTQTPEKTGIAKFSENLKESTFGKEMVNGLKQSPVVKTAMAAKSLLTGVFAEKESKTTPESNKKTEGTSQTSTESIKDNPDKSAEKEMSALSRLQKFKENISKENLARLAKEKAEDAKNRLLKKLGFEQDMKDSSLRMAQSAKEQAVGDKAFAKDKAKHTQRLAMGKARMFSDKLEMVTKLKNNALKMASDAAAFVKEKAHAMMTIAIRGAKAAASMVQRAFMLPFPLNAIALASGAALVAGGVLLAKKMLSGDSGGGTPGGAGGGEGKEKEDKESGSPTGQSTESLKNIAKEEKKERSKSSDKSPLPAMFWKMTMLSVLTLLKKIADNQNARGNQQLPQQGTFGNGQGVGANHGTGAPGNGSTQTDVRDSFASTRYSPNMTRNM